MSRRRELGQRIEALGEIRSILSAMKNLALMETQLLSQSLPSQRQLVASIEQTASELIAWHPELAPTNDTRDQLYLLIGSEQGFCGDYNEQLSTAFELHPASCIVIGQRLIDRLQDHPQVLITLPGTTVAEEVPTTLLRLSDAVTTQLRHQLSLQPEINLGISVLYHNAGSGTLCDQSLLPLTDLPPAPAAPFGPELNCAPDHLWNALSDHYLFAALNRILYSALMSENRQRLAHMERALHRLDERSHDLKIAYNAQRQEEIVEEIEVIVLSADLLGAKDVPTLS